MATATAPVRYPASFDDRPYHGIRMPLDEYERLLDEDEIKPSIEWWDGVVEQKFMGKKKHGRSTRFFTVKFWDLSIAPGADGGPEIHIWFTGRGWRVPDFVYWRPGKDSGPEERAYPPTLAIEIVSRRQSLRGQREKCRLMRSLGVDICWLIDPERQHVEIFDSEHDGAVVPPDGDLGHALIPGLTIHLPELWASISR